MADVAHLTDEQRQSISDKCGVAQAFLMALRSEMESKPKHEDLSSSIADIERKQMLLESEITAILNTPPPKPKKEEEKKEESAAADSGAA